MRLKTGLFALALAVALPALAQADARKITWEDLLPPVMPELDRDVDRINEMLEAQPPGLKRDFQNVMYDLMDRQVPDNPSTEVAVTRKEMDAIRDAVGDDNFTAALELWTTVKDVRARLRKAEQAVDPALDGQRIRMPGYLLPLEFDGGEVTEFLLVPYIGACIHVPAPPPNQMVFVRSGTSVAADGLFAPVWVEGTLRTESGSYDLFLVDGTNSVDAGYVMDAVEVTAY